MLADQRLVDQRLVDQHCHGVVRTSPGRAAFEQLLTEAVAPAPGHATFFDTQLGFAVRRWCAPCLGLDAHAPPEEYLRRRAELGPAAATERLMAAAGLRALLVDTGFGGPPEGLSPAELATAAGASGHEVVRLETIAERVAGAGPTASGYAGALDAALRSAARDAVGVKTVLAYRHGLDVEPARPAEKEVRAAAGRWLAGLETGLETGLDAGRAGVQTGTDAGTDTALHTGAEAVRGAGSAPPARLTDPVLLRHLLWAGVDLGLPIQIHTGFGDPDLDLRRSDPALLTGFLRAVQSREVPIVLLHCYPFHRHAGYLANVFPQVYADVGLTLGHVGARAPAVLAEALELTPFHKLLFSTDAYGLPELYLVGAATFRQALDRTLRAWVVEGSWSGPDAQRVAEMVGGANAMRLYRLE